MVALKVVLLKSANKEIKVVKTEDNIYAVSTPETFSTEKLNLTPDILQLKNKINSNETHLSEKEMALINLADLNNDMSLNVLAEFISLYGNKEADFSIYEKAIQLVANYSNKDLAITTLEKLEDKQRAGRIGDTLRRAVIDLRFNKNKK